MLSAALALLILTVTFLLPSMVRGNTEIVNFDAQESRDITFPVTADWPVLKFGEAERIWRVSPAPPHASNQSTAVFASPHELWLILDLDSREWARYTKFTLRISWPASSPADFSIQIFSPELLASVVDDTTAQQSFQPSTRRKYARVSLHDTAVRTPTSRPDSEAPSAEPVPFVVLLEPLYFGVLPASVTPVVVLLTFVVSFAAMVVVPFVNRYIFAVARQAREEIAHLQDKQHT
ncbi:hypothetical protein SCP_0102200 [Sparassis crispa]|uniref:Uncharacterized protein n=1 Tax=Sparassis crispa TaxID=139825 RepID=A0A401G5A9_9APHY|nr:hypothetical protein SCP_0102200 [Sparassis crispa]GBE77347.1 hypothetical protein SCP_0102200 [Sparassis crispa]